jgi:hypothetical protein
MESPPKPIRFKDLITALEKMPQSYPVMAGWLPRRIDPEWVDGVELPVLRDVRLVGGEVVLA